ncbi:hypothetical protein DF3PA_110001 [Candidatus Defluviicoccus seviourii]|uniref:Uncharacterized protein n=1 Tax=Candidatus Defluviicoccus seviourii TaxID=2565273 RepID=A0A564WAW4_9PROT|nr:hypothetical protein DF3PA_110001 [Candidatus Defluviicoccus seviourii]
MVSGTGTASVGRRERIEILAKLRHLFTPLLLQSVKGPIGYVSALKPHDKAPNDYGKSVVASEGRFDKHCGHKQSGCASDRLIDLGFSAVGHLPPLGMRSRGAKAPLRGGRSAESAACPRRRAAG